MRTDARPRPAAARGHADPSRSRREPAPFRPSQEPPGTSDVRLTRLKCTPLRRARTRRRSSRRRQVALVPASPAMLRVHSRPGPRRGRADHRGIARPGPLRRAMAPEVADGPIPRHPMKRPRHAGRPARQPGAGRSPAPSPGPQVLAPPPPLLKDAWALVPLLAALALAIHSWFAFVGEPMADDFDFL